MWHLAIERWDVLCETHNLVSSTKWPEPMVSYPLLWSHLAVHKDTWYYHPESGVSKSTSYWWDWDSHMSKNKKEPEAVFPFYCMVMPCSPPLKVPEGALLETSQQRPDLQSKYKPNFGLWTSWAFISNWMTPLEPSPVILLHLYL